MGGPANLPEEGADPKRGQESGSYRPARPLPLHLRSQLLQKLVAGGGQLASVVVLVVLVVGDEGLGAQGMGPQGRKGPAEEGWPGGQTVGCWGQDRWEPGRRTLRLLRRWARPPEGTGDREGTTESPVAKFLFPGPGPRVGELGSHRLSPGSGVGAMTGGSEGPLTAQSPWGQLCTREPAEPSFPARR